MNWSDLQFLLAAARAGSVAGAAKRLGVNDTTVSRRLSRLETAMGARLFERHPGRLVPTEAGGEALGHAERAEREIEAALSGVGRVAADVAGTVRITAVPFVVNHLLTPRLPAFLAQHPALGLDLVAEPRDLSLTRRETDIALRLARPEKDMQAVARRIGEIRFGIYARAGRVPDTLPWLSYEDSMSALPQARWIGARVAGAAGETLATARYNDLEGILQAARAGLGRALLPVAIGDGDADLAQCEPDSPLSRELWMLVHPDVRTLSRIRVVLNWLGDVAKAL